MSYLYLLLFVSIAQAQFIRTFSSDGCTYYPDGTKEQPKLWYLCCFEHDMRYWVGGDKIDEEISDLKLRQCVEEKAGKFQGQLMYTGIRLGHFSPVKSKTKWSWGWRHEKKYTRLTDLEKLAAKKSLEQMTFEDAQEETIKVKFIKENLID